MLLLSVLIIFVSPAIGLEPTALRALKMADLLFAAIALAGTIVVTGLSGEFKHLVASIHFFFMLARIANRVDLNCTRLC